MNNKQIIKNISKPRTWMQCIIVLGIVSFLVIHTLMPMVYNQMKLSKIIHPNNLIMPNQFRPRASSKYLGKNEYMNCLIFPTIKSNSSIFLPDIMDSEVPPVKNSIFFHETSCSKDHTQDLDFLQACAIESAADANPNTEIYVLFASPRLDISNKSYALMGLLDSFGNVHFRNNDIWKYSKKTPARKWLSKGYIFQSEYVKDQLQSFLAYLSLWKWEGTFID
uniref:Hexosyltransferase n=1 Tax=Megaselia scalaris TaxID=36166 RepID=T1GYD9_MEGSC